MKKVILTAFLIFVTKPVVAKEDIKFEKKTLQLGTVFVIVEIADTQEKSARGLMYRKSLSDNSGMLFIFPDEAPRNFWMKNTFVPLDIGFFNSKMELFDIQQMEPVSSELQVNIPTYPSHGPAMYALEMPKGWFEKNKIRLKQRFSIK